MMNKLRYGQMLMKKDIKGRSIISSLPQDTLVEVAIQLASKSSTPLDNIRSLRATCKSFHRASRDKLVGRSMAVDKEEKRWWEENNSYLALLRNCADCGNLEAHFILGVEELYNSRRAVSGLQHLQLAMDGGHLTAAYFLGVVLFRQAATRSDAMEILNRVSSGDLSNTAADVAGCTISGNPIIDRCREEAVKMVSRNWKKEWEMELRSPCTHPLCGAAAKSRDQHWVKRDCLPRAFCSEFCRWAYECHSFFEKIN